MRSGSRVFTHEVDCEGMKESSLKNLKQDLKLNGYAWIRGLINEDDVERAREAVRKFHNEKVGGVKGITYTGMKDITYHRDVLKVVESSEIVRIFETILNRNMEKVLISGTRERHLIRMLSSSNQNRCIRWIPLVT